MEVSLRKLWSINIRYSINSEWFAGDYEYKPTRETIEQAVAEFYVGHPSYMGDRVTVHVEKFYQSEDAKS